MKTKTIKGWVVYIPGIPFLDKGRTATFHRTRSELLRVWKKTAVVRATLTVEVPDGA